MIFGTAACLLLALSITSANQVQVKVDELIIKISTEVASEMARVAEVERNTGITELELNGRLLKASSLVLWRLQPEIKTIIEISGNSASFINNLSVQITRNPVLKKAISSGGKTEPRFVGALLIGITQIVTDVVNMSLRRY